MKQCYICKNPTLNYYQKKTRSENQRFVVYICKKCWEDEIRHQTRQNVEVIPIGLSREKRK